MAGPLTVLSPDPPAPHSSETMAIIDRQNKIASEAQRTARFEAALRNTNDLRLFHTVFKAFQTKQPITLTHQLDLAFETRRMAQFFAQCDPNDRALFMKTYNDTMKVLQREAQAGRPTAQPSARRRITIDIPNGARHGDKIAFSMATGANGTLTNYTTVVPTPPNTQAPIKKISMEIPLMPGMSATAPLIIHKLTLNGLPIPQAPPTSTPPAPADATGATRDAPHSATTARTPKRKRAKTLRREAQSHRMTNYWQAKKRNETARMKDAHKEMTRSNAANLLLKFANTTAPPRDDTTSPLA